MIPQLDALIRAAQAASGLVIGRQTPAHAALRDALASDPSMATEARARLGAIHRDVLERDHVSRWLKSTLEGALPEETA